MQYQVSDELLTRFLLIDLLGLFVVSTDKTEVGQGTPGREPRMCSSKTRSVFIYDAIIICNEGNLQFTSHPSEEMIVGNQPRNRTW